MRFNRKRVALIYGGRGCERDVSLMSASAMAESISRSFECIKVEITKDGIWQNEEKKQLLCAKIDNRCGFFMPDGGSFLEIDCAFPLLHGDFGEDGRVQGALDFADIPYIGCDGPVGAICRDKSVVKSVAKRIGIPTLKFAVARSYAEAKIIAEEQIGYPLFIKPCTLGSSIGANKVESEGELKKATELAFIHSDKIIIEPYLKNKRELECGYFGTECKEIFTNVGEILTGGNFYDYESKYGGERTECIPRADVPEEINKKIKEYSKRLVKELGVKQLSRIDFFLSEGEIFLNEINTMPGFTVGSLYPAMLSEAGIDRDSLVKMLVLDQISGK